MATDAYLVCLSVHTQRGILRFKRSSGGEEASFSRQRFRLNHGTNGDVGVSRSDSSVSGVGPKDCSDKSLTECQGVG